MGNYWQRPLGAKLILLLALAFLAETLAPWQRVCAVTSEAGDRVCGWRTAYEGSQFGTYMAILAVAILVWESLPVLAPRLSMRGWPTAIVSDPLGRTRARDAREAHRGQRVPDDLGVDRPRDRTHDHVRGAHSRAIPLGAPRP